MRIGAIAVLLVLNQFALAQVLYPEGTPTSQPAGMLADGAFLLRRSGQVARSDDGKTWVFTPDFITPATQPVSMSAISTSAPASQPATTQPTLTILPNLELYGVEQRLKDSDGKGRFLLSGLVTQYTPYLGTPENHLLIEAAAPEEAVLAADKIEPPASQPTGNLPPDQMLNRMLKPTTASSARAIRPTTTPSKDLTSGRGAVAPNAPVLTVIREGQFLVDRTGRLTRGGDGQSWEFNFDSDTRTMKDAPVVILPNLKLMAMEQAVRSSQRDLRFKITGMVTEYNGRNYVLLEKVVVIPDVIQQF